MHLLIDKKNFYNNKKQRRRHKTRDNIFEIELGIKKIKDSPIYF